MSLMFSLGDIFGSVLKTAGMASNPLSSGLQNAFSQEQIQKEIQEFTSKVSETKAYASEADKRYTKLLDNKLNSVPAIDLYTATEDNGSYTENLNQLILQFTESINTISQASSTTGQDSSSQLAEIKAEYETQLATTATQIQTFLREDTSDLECAKIWDAKFVKAMNEHIPPHDKKGEFSDGTMSVVMEAYRRWAETDAYTQQFFGSQNLINVTYEAVLEGYDAFDYMGDIINLASQELFGGVENEYDSVIVPNAEFSLFSF